MADSDFSSRHTVFVGSMLALIATAAWSGNFISAKILSPQMSPIAMIFWRMGLATLFMLPLALGSVREHWAQIKSQLHLLAFYGFIGMCLANIFYYTAPKTATAVNMVILAAIAPLFMMIYARVLFGEPITKRRIVGSGIALLGVATLVTKGHLEQLAHVHLTPGDFWTLAGAACFSLYSVSLRYFKIKLPVRTFVLAIFGLGFLWTLPLFIWDSWGNFLPPTDGASLLALLYIGIIASCVAFLCWTAAIARIGAVRAGIIYFLLPVFGVVEAVVLLKEGLAAAQVIGGLLVLGGVIFSSLPAHLPFRLRCFPWRPHLPPECRGKP